MWRNLLCVSCLSIGMVIGGCNHSDVGKVETATPKQQTKTDTSDKQATSVSGSDKSTVQAVENAPELEVRTYPDGIRDDRTAYLFSDEIAALSFHIYTKEPQPVKIKKGALALTLPKGLRIICAGVYRTPKTNATECVVKDGGKNEWRMDIGTLDVNEHFKLYSHYPLLPWNTASLHFLMVAEGAASLPADFDIPWKLTGEGFKNQEGHIKTCLIPLSKKRKTPKRFKVWDFMFPYGGIVNERTWELAMKFHKDIGVNGLIQSGGAWFPECADAATFRDAGIGQIMMQSLSYSLRATPDTARKAGFNVREEDCAVNILGNRMPDNSFSCLNKLSSNYYCYAGILEDNSPAMDWIMNGYKKYIDPGCRWFFDDYESSPYDFCYCPKCRAAFARYSGLPEDECMTSSPAALIYAHPFEWHCFKTDQTGKVLAKIRSALVKISPDIRIGFNENMVRYEYYLPRFNGYGASYWAEDPRITDPYIDFHDADALGSGLETIYALDLFFQKKPSGEFWVNKPVIARVCSFIWVNWQYHITLARMEDARRKSAVMGCDMRPLNQKLEIANSAAVGVKGIETASSIFSSDALVVNGVVRGLDYVAEFEDLVDVRNRLDWKAAEMYDSTAVKSPYHDTERQGTQGKFYYNSAKKFGFIQYTCHRSSEGFLLSIFNWDYYQAKNVSVKFPDMFSGAFYLHLYKDGDRLLCVKDDQKEIWDASELRRGVSLEIPAGGICALLAADKPRTDYTRSVGAVSEQVSTKNRIELYSWRKPPVDDLRYFYEYPYNVIMKNFESKKVPGIRLYPETQGGK